MHILIVKAFLTESFPSPSKTGQKFALGGNKVEIESFVFGTQPTKGTSLRETASFDLLIAKIGAGVLTVGCRKNQKKTGQVT